MNSILEADGQPQMAICNKRRKLGTDFYLGILRILSGLSFPGKWQGRLFQDLTGCNSIAVEVVKLRWLYELGA